MHLKQTNKQKSIQVRLCEGKKYILCGSEKSSASNTGGKWSDESSLEEKYKRDANANSNNRKNFEIHLE